MEAGGLNARDGLLRAPELFVRCVTIGFVGRVKVGHDAFDLERWAGPEASEKGVEIGGEIHTLATHAGIDFEMHRDCGSVRTACCGIEFVEVGGIPDYGDEVLTQQLLALTGKDASDSEDAGIGT